MLSNQEVQDIIDADSFNHMPGYLVWMVYREGGMRIRRTECVSCCDQHSLFFETSRVDHNMALAWLDQHTRVFNWDN